MSDYSHYPVLLKEAIVLLAPISGGIYFDGTLGGGGYTKAMLDTSAPDGTVLATDLDPASIEHFKSSYPQLLTRVTLVQGNFADIVQIAEHKKIPAPDGIVADIGFSSFQLDNPERGIAFKADGPLDMRFNPAQEKTATFIIEHAVEAELADIFYHFGEEKLSRKIARKIVETRKISRIETTNQLVSVVETAVSFLPPLKRTDCVRRVFQALRIAVNSELDNLQNFLPTAFDYLKPGGVLAIVSFHSLEDRIVKQFFAGLANGCVCPPDFPICQCGKSPKGKILTPKPIVASEHELLENPRSKPAKLRAIKKIA